MSSRSWKVAAVGILIAASAGLAVAHAESNSLEHRGPGMMHGMGPGMMGMHGMGMAHDDATMAQLADIHELFINHDKIKRTVENLPDGIRNTTESDDPHIAQLIKDHVASMGKRVETGNDPGLPIESDALHSIFKDYGKIATKTETTDKGVIVIQTSADKDTAASLQQHASEVSDFVAQGMQAMRNSMMKKMGGMMAAAMHGMAGHMGPMHPQEN